MESIISLQSIHAISLFIRLCDGLPLISLYAGQYARANSFAEMTRPLVGRFDVISAGRAPPRMLMVISLPLRWQLLMIVAIYKFECTQPATRHDIFRL